MATARWTIVGIALLAGIAVAEEAPPLNDEEARRSYALGVALGNQLRSRSVAVDADLHHRGLKDALSGAKTLLTEPEVRAAVDRLQAELKQRRRSPPRETLGAAAPAGGLQVSFKLDPRVTKSLYMGERWVSGARYSSALAPEGEAITVEARARPAGAAGEGEASPRWTASDPEMATISPGEGDDVKLTVRRAGESTVTVSHGDVSRAFSIKTVHLGDRWRVELSKLQPPPAAQGVTGAAASSAANARGR